MRAINLLPVEQRAGRKLTISRTKMLAIAGGALAVFGGYYAYSLKGQASDLREQVAQAEQDKATVQSEIARRQATARSSSQLQEFRGTVAGIAAARTNWDRIIRDIAIVTPKQAWLTTLRVETPKTATSAVAPAAAAAGSAGTPIPAPIGVHIEGYTYTPEQVGVVLARFGVIKGLGEPRLTSSDRTTIGNRKVIKFVVDMAVDRRAQDLAELTAETSTGSAPAGG